MNKAFVATYAYFFSSTRSAQQSSSHLRSVARYSSTQQQVLREGWSGDGARRLMMPSSSQPPATACRLGACHPGSARPCRQSRQTTGRRWFPVTRSHRPTIRGVLSTTTAQVNTPEEPLSAAIYPASVETCIQLLVDDRPPQADRKVSFPSAGSESFASMRGCRIQAPSEHLGVQILVAVMNGCGA